MIPPSQNVKKTNLLSLTFILILYLNLNYNNDVMCEMNNL